jgi:HD-GYP domain-containing protein (c-di-GMP phosphodiesterase class II)
VEVKQHANCIYVADRLDVLALAHIVSEQDILLAKDEIRRLIYERRGDWFCPELVDALMDVSHSEAFWFALEGEHVNGYLATWLSHYPPRTLEFHELRSLVHVFSCIVDAKSHFTKQHSDGVANLARYLGALFKLPEMTCEMLELAGLLHDIGKLRVPDELLEKRGRLSETEVILMRRHSFDTYGILKSIRGLEEVSMWASQHHERVDGSGYPYETRAGEISLEARIVAVADVFQALAQERPYRGPLEPQAILANLKQQAEEGKLDGRVVAMVEANLDQCWRAAMIPSEGSGRC